MAERVNVTDETKTPLSPAPASGGAMTAFSENVDLNNPKDVGLVRQLLLRNGKRWPIIAGERARLVERVTAAAEGGNLFADRLLADLEKANQVDELERAKHQRLDDGKLTDAVEFFVRPPRVLPGGEA
jgi:hypothetical protein